MSFAIASDVVVRLGNLGANLTAAQVAQIEAFLDDAEQLILLRIPDLAAQVAADPPTIASRNVVAVEAAAVRRVMLNSEGFVSETIDGWSGTRANILANGLLYISDEEWAMLLPTIAGRRRGSIRMVANGEAYYGQPYFPPVYTP